MSKTVTLRISEDQYEAFRRYARSENRKISNAIETLAMKQLERARYLESLEEDSILANENLMGRIGTGIKQAKARKGRYQAIAVGRDRK